MRYGVICGSISVCVKLSKRCLSVESTCHTRQFVVGSPSSDPKSHATYGSIRRASVIFGIWTKSSSNALERNSGVRWIKTAPFSMKSCRSGVIKARQRQKWHPALTSVRTRASIIGPRIAICRSVNGNEPCKAAPLALGMLQRFVSMHSATRNCLSVPSRRRAAQTIRYHRLEAIDVGKIAAGVA